MRPTSAGSRPGCGWAPSSRRPACRRCRRSGTSRVSPARRSGGRRRRPTSSCSGSPSVGVVVAAGIAVGTNQRLGSVPAEGSPTAAGSSVDHRRTGDVRTAHRHLTAPAGRAAGQLRRPRRTGSSGPRRSMVIRPDRRIRSRTDPRTWLSRRSIAEPTQLDGQRRPACPWSRRRGRRSRRCRG